SHLEEQEDDADVGEDRELLPVGDIARGEGRNNDPDQQVSDYGGQAQGSGSSAREGGEQEQEAELEDGRCRAVHSRENRRATCPNWPGDPRRHRSARRWRARPCCSSLSTRSVTVATCSRRQWMPTRPGSICRTDPSTVATSSSPGYAIGRCCRIRWPSRSSTGMPRRPAG